MSKLNVLDVIAGIGLLAFLAGLYLWFGLAIALTVGGLFLFVGSVYLASRVPVGSENVGDDTD
jgi:hypothetical protein